MVSDTLALLGMICCDSGLRAGQRPQRADVLQNTGVNFHTSVRPSFRPSVLPSILAWVSQGLTQTISGQNQAPLVKIRPPWAKIRPPWAKIRPPWAKIRPPGLRSGPSLPSSGLGGGDGRTDGRTEGRTDVWKFTPVFYRTSALWGRCPKSVT